MSVLLSVAANGGNVPRRPTVKRWPQPLILLRTSIQHHSVPAKAPSRKTQLNFDGYKDDCICVISGFCRKVAENCTLLGYYAASIGNFLPTLRENLSVPSSGFRNQCLNPRMGPIGCTETSVRNYHYSLLYWPRRAHFSDDCIVPFMYLITVTVLCMTALF